MEQTDSGKDSATTRTLSRGLAVLSEILGAGSPPTLTELALRTGLAKATVSRLLATLVDAGFAAQQPLAQTYVPGVAVARWLRSSPLEALLIEHAAPAMDQLRDLCGETIALCVPIWPNRVCVATSDSPAPIRAHKAVGETAALTRGCTGRAFLAFANGPYVDAALQARPLVPLTPASVAEPDAFFERIASERRQGYAMSVGGTFPDMNGIAVPIFSSTSSLPIAVLNASGPSTRWTADKMVEFAPVLKQHAAEISSYFTSQVLS